MTTEFGFSFVRWQKAGALVIASFALAGLAAAQSPTTVAISMTNFAFTPDTLHFKAGVTYRLHFSNDGASGHNFRAPDFFAASQVEQSDKSKIEDGSVEVDADQKTVDVTVTPIRPGTHSFNCSHFLHSMMGMHGKIVVE